MKLRANGLPKYAQTAEYASDTINKGNLFLFV